MFEHWKSIAAELRHFGKATCRVLVYFYFSIVVLLVLLHYPYDVDQSVHLGSGFNSPLESESDARLRPGRSSAFYEAAYSGRNQFDVALRRGLDYEETVKSAAEANQIPQQVAGFGLRDKKVLEVESGTGYLQDLVADYTGLDSSAAAARNYHKNFEVASATAMPFADRSFDTIWTIWVLEHVSNPERTLREMRSVLKPGGKLYLDVAWRCQRWPAGGFSVRPYSNRCRGYRD